MATNAISTMASAAPDLVHTEDVSEISPLYSPSLPATIVPNEEMVDPGEETG